MKIFQIMNGICHWQTPYTKMIETVGRYAPDIEFAEAPDYVFEGWGYLDGKFIKPTPPKGWIYDEQTGTFYPENMPSPEKTRQINELKTRISATDYKIIKCSEYQLAGLPLPYDVATLHSERQALRDEINTLETAK
ncbi:MAG: hypothetical protein RR209_00685 [Angelakisella sp.]